MRPNPPAGPAAPAEWLDGRRFALLLAGLFVLTYPGLLAGTRTLFFRDYGVIAYPTIAYQHDCFWRGQWPGWDPYSHCGAPFAAQWGVMSLYPFSLIYLLLPLPWSLTVFWAGHLYLGGLGLRRLALAQTHSPFAAGVAGIAYVFNGLVFSSLAWPNYAVALGWMPWVVFLAEKAWRTGGRSLPVAALAGAMQMLSGVPEITLLTWVLLGFFWLGDLLREKTERVALVLRFALLPVLVAGLCAAQLLPFFDLLSRSQRDSGFGSAGWSMPGWGWASLVVPLFHAAQSPQGVFYQPRHVFITSYYLGLCWMTVAAFAALFCCFPRRLVLVCATAAGLVLALGDDGFLFPFLKKLFPQLGFARFPVKFFYLSAFCLPLLAAQGVAALMASSTRRNSPGRDGSLGRPTGLHPEMSEISAEPAGRMRRRFGLVLGLACAAVGLIVVFGWRFPFPADHPFQMAVNAAERAGLMLAAGCGLLLAAGKQGAIWERFAPMAVLAVLWLDAVSYSPHLFPTLPSEAFAAGEPPMKPAPELGVSRAMVSAHAEEHLYASRVPDFFNDYLGKRLALWSNLNLIQRIPKVDGALTLQIREEAEVESALRGRGTNSSPKLLDFLGVSQITAPGKVVDWQERPTARPWLTAGQAPRRVPANLTLAAVLQPNFEPSREVILEGPGTDFLTNTAYQPNARVKTVRFESNRIEVETESPTATMLVMAQTYHPNWRAWVDGHAVPLRRADHAFQALALPAGRHTVILLYLDRPLRIGIAVSLATLVGALLLHAKSDRGSDGSSAVSAAEPPGRPQFSSGAAGVSRRRENPV